MKKLLVWLLVLCSPALFAQKPLKLVYLPADLTLHFISPEPVRYVDISSAALTGDLPLNNVVRLKLKDSLKTFREAVITIAGEKFIAQYRLIPGDAASLTEIPIVPADMRPLDIAGIGFSQNQLRSMSLRLIARKPGKRVEKAKAFGLTGQLNHIYSAGDYLFLDISYRNRTSLKYDIADLYFSVDDKKAAKAANSQSIPVKPVFSLFSMPSFAKNYRNVIVFKKMSFPGNKVLRAELSEKQISGRVITLNISYRDILDADTLPD